MGGKAQHPKPSWLIRTIVRLRAAYEYCREGVWSSAENTLGIRLIKTANLSVRSFLDRGLQSKSMALTYSTVLAIVPAFALLVAIGRGFGLQNVVERELYIYFPSQGEAVSTALSFVDRYLNQATQGLFVGIGIVFLLWTLISLLSSIEEAFNNIWDIKSRRGILQKITDYIAICLIIPILMLCSSGVSIFMSTIVQSGPGAEILTPVVNTALEISPFILTWLAFVLSFWLIPNTKVSFKYAAISGAVCALAFTILQLLFVNGQIYVSKYNAIYGSFAFLPLLLIWLQFSWLILLFGCVLTYSLQNIFAFNFLGNIENVSDRYMHKVLLVVMAIVVKRFLNGKKPLTPNDISMEYDLPIRLVNRIVIRLHDAKLIYYVVGENQEITVAPAVDANTLTVGELIERVDNVGESDFIPRFARIYSALLRRTEVFFSRIQAGEDEIFIKDLDVPTATEVSRLIRSSEDKEEKKH